MNIHKKIKEANQAFKDGNHTQVENICQNILKKNSKNPEAITLLGMVLFKRRKIKQALGYFLKALPKMPANATLLSNIGLCYLELDESAKAQSYLLKAYDNDITNPDITLNLGAAYFKNKDYGKFMELSKKAAAIQPDDFQSRENYALGLYKTGHISESINEFYQAIQLNPNSNETLLNIVKNLMSIQNYSEAEHYTERALQSTNLPLSILLEFQIAYVIILFLQNKFDKANHIISQMNINSPEISEYHNIINIKAFYTCIKYAISYYQNNPQDYEKCSSDPIYFLCESHCFPAHGLKLPYHNEYHNIESKFVRGIKIWHLLQNKNSEMKSSFEFTLNTIPNNSKVVIGIGEIDCRINEGIFHVYIRKGVDFKQNIDSMLVNYIEYLKKLIQDKNFDIIFYGVPAPHPVILQNVAQEQRVKFLEMIKYYNEKFKSLCGQYAFIDIYQLTRSENGESNLKYHTDNYHMRPDAIINAFKSSI